MGRVVRCVKECERAWLSKVTFVVITVGIVAACSQHIVTVSEEVPPLPPKAILERWQAKSPEPPETPQGPLTLERAIEEALLASPELAKIRQRIRAAAEQVRQADSTFYPRLIVSEDYNITNNPVFALMDIINQRRLQTNVDFNNPGTQENFGSRIRGEWSLFEGGSHWYDRKAAIAQQRSISAELQAARNQMVAKITEIYYQWLQTLAFIGVAERALESAQTDERLGEARVRAETALPNELSRLKARRAEAHGNLVTAQTNAQRLRAGLESLMARPIQPTEIPEHTIGVAVEQVEDHKKDADQCA